MNGGYVTVYIDNETFGGMMNSTFSEPYTLPDDVFYAFKNALEGFKPLIITAEIDNKRVLIPNTILLNYDEYDDRGGVIIQAGIGQVVIGQIDYTNHTFALD